MIIIICGLPGVGKSTLAKALADRKDYKILSSDKIRKEVFVEPTYSAYERKLVYDIMTLVAKYLHESGTSCILDATFNRQDSRMEIKKRLNLQNNEFVIVECVCPEEIVISRLRSRRDEYSDATITTYKRMQRIYEPVSSEHITVDTTLDPQDNAQEILSRIN